MLRDTTREFHLYLNESGGRELHEWRQLDVAGGKWTDVRAFMFERRGKRVVAYWHVHGRGRLLFSSPLGAVDHLDAEGMKYFETDLPSEAVCEAFASAAVSSAADDSPRD